MNEHSNPQVCYQSYASYMKTSFYSVTVNRSRQQVILSCTLHQPPLPPSTSSAIVAAIILTTSTVATMMLVMLTTVRSTSSPLVLRCILQLAPCNCSANHTQETMSSPPLLASITTSYSTTNGTQETALAFFARGCIGVVGSIRVTTLLPVTLLLLLVSLLTILRCGTVTWVLGGRITARRLVSGKTGLGRG